MKHLTDAGLKIWFDQWSLVPGQNWEQEIRRAIKESSAIVMCFGPKSSQSQVMELNTVLERQITDQSKFIVPVLLPGADWQSVPASLRDLSAVDLRENIDNSREINRLVAATMNVKEPGAIAQEAKTGDALRAAGDSAGAIRHYERALSMGRAAYSESHPFMIDILNRLAGALQETGKYSEAQQTLHEALYIVRSLQQTNPAAYGESIARTLNNLGSVLRDRGELDEALAYFREALEIDRHALGPDHPNVGMTLNNLGGVYLSSGQTEEARKIYEEAYDVLSRSFGKKHPLTVAVQENIAKI